MKARVSLFLSAIVVLAVLTATLGCSKAPNDAQIASDIQTKLNADSGLQGKQISVQAANGTATLSGTVDNENQRDAAARYAASAAGIKQVVNNLQVAPPVAAQTTEEQPAMQPEPPKPARTKPAASRPRSRTLPVTSSDSSPAPAAAPAPAMAQMTPTPTAPSTPPPPQKVTIPSGTTLAVRLVDTIDSETSQPGQTFHATLDSPLAVEGDVVIPAGYDVEGHIVTVQSAGKFWARSRSWQRSSSTARTLGSSGSRLIVWTSPVS